MPTQDDVLGYFDTLSNWGRWGDDDELGTLNHITDDVRLAAARAVRHGRSVSCAWEVAVPEDMERSTTTCPCAADMPGAETCRCPVPQRPALGLLVRAARHHVPRQHHHPPRLAVPHLLGRHDVQRAVALAGRRRDGIGVGGRHGGGERDRHAWCPAGRRGVRDVPWLEPGQGVFPDDLEEAERRQGVRVRSGDAVLLRTGFGRARHEAGATAVSRRPAGTRPACRGCRNGRSR
jgi:hypothetical protein